MGLKIINRIIRFFTTLVLGLLIVGLFISFLFPIAYKDYINRYSRLEGLDPFLVAAIINVESKYDKRAVSHKNARGLMQITDQTGRWGAQELGIDNYKGDILYDPETNIQIGAWYVKKLMEEFDNNLTFVLAAYNAGSGNVSKWLQNKDYSDDGSRLDRIPFEETKNYLDKVYVNYKVYKFLYRDYMEKPDSINSIYIDGIIYIRSFLSDFMKSFKAGGII